METTEPLQTIHRRRPESRTDGPSSILLRSHRSPPNMGGETRLCVVQRRRIVVQQTMLLLCVGLSRSCVVRALPSTCSDDMPTTFPRISESVDDTPGVGKRLDQNTQIKVLAIRPNEAEVRNSPGAKSNTAG